jgi:hypothetical protein
VLPDKRYIQTDRQTDRHAAGVRSFVAANFSFLLYLDFLLSPRTGSGTHTTVSNPIHRRLSRFGIFTPLRWKVLAPSSG